MTDKNNFNRTTLTTSICVTYLLLIIFYYHIDKHISGVLFTILFLLIPILFLTIIVFTIINFILIYKQRHSLTLKVFLPMLICILTLSYTIFSPYRLDSEYLESPIEFRACYEGTQNQATIKFREDKTFELHWTGAFFANDWWSGKWSRNGDTINFSYDKEKSEQLGEKVLIYQGYLRPIGNPTDSMKYKRPMFYLGFCRHEN